MKSYTDLEQSKKLAEILPIESADMVLPFTHKENNEYVPGYAVSRNYIEVYNEMLLLRTMDKDTICKLMQPCWSLSALLEQLDDEITDDNGNDYNLTIVKESLQYQLYYHDSWGQVEDIETDYYDDLVDACVEMIEKLHKQKLL